MAQFESAVTVVLKHEGGFVDDENDPGGRTKYGISQRSYPHVDIANLTVEEAKEIYYKDFWKPFGYEFLKSTEVCNKLFDISVNVGTKRAHTKFQEAVNFLTQQYQGANDVDKTFDSGLQINVVVDGRVGKKTAAAANKLSWEALLYTFQVYMGQYYLSINNPRFIKGWLRRLMN